MVRKDVVNKVAVVEERRGVMNTDVKEKRCGKDRCWVKGAVMRKCVVNTDVAVVEEGRCEDGYCRW